MKFICILLNSPCSGVRMIIYYTDKPVTTPEEQTDRMGALLRGHVLAIKIGLNQLATLGKNICMTNEPGARMRIEIVS